MNLHEVVNRRLLGQRFEHSFKAWARVVRLSEGQAHIYEMPGLHNRVAARVNATLWNGEIPVPECGKKPRGGVHAFQMMHADNAGARPWSRFCADCRNIENQMDNRLTYNNYWTTIYNEHDLDVFYAAAQAAAIR